MFKPEPRFSIREVGFLLFDNVFYVHTFYYLGNALKKENRHV